MRYITSFEEAAKSLAVKAHSATNHLYDGYLPYEFHLRLVVRFAERFIDLIPETNQSRVYAACWLHDSIEDARLTYNDVRNNLLIDHKDASILRAATDVGNIVFAVTNSKGKTRKERADQSYYDGINAVSYAPFVKLCDRMANITYSKIFGGQMLDMYRNEHSDFMSKLEVPGKVFEKNLRFF